MRRSKKNGKSTSVAEVLDVTPRGVWIYVNHAEYFLSYKLYPWFLKARAQQIFDVKILHGHHLYWPQLDVDLELASLQRPENYPLVYQ